MEEENMTIIEWILSRTRENYFKQTVTQKKPERKPRMKVDQHIKYCLKCEVTWYYHRAGGSQAGKWSYNTKYSIPTLGKNRQLCPECAN